MKKRILMLLSVVALMVVMLVVSVAPAFAAWSPVTGCRTGDTLLRFEPGAFPELEEKDRNDDNQVCLTHRGPEGSRVAFYDNRLV